MAIASLAVLCFTGCKDAKIDKEYNPGFIDNSLSYVDGTFRQGDEATNVKIILAYENGLGRTVTVYVPEINGVYADPMVVKLADASANDNGNGIIEIPLLGTPIEKKTGTDKMKLRPTIKFDTHEVYVTFEELVTAEILLTSTTSVGNMAIFQPITDAKIVLGYNTTKAIDVSINVAEVSGIMCPEFTTTLPAAPAGGTIEIPLSGTPEYYGEMTLVVRVADRENEYNINAKIEVKGEITLYPNESMVVGNLNPGVAITTEYIALKYSAEQAQAVTVSVAAVNGVSVPAYDVTFAATPGTTGVQNIPLTGTPGQGDIETLTIEIKKGNIVYSATIIVNPGVPFVEETITYQGLTYKTVFVDINGNGLANRGEVWLDRNIGATSNDPGTYGTGNGNPASFGDYCQYGAAYGATYSPSYVIDYATMTPWNICPPGYQVPSMELFVKAMNSLVPGSTISGNNLTGVVGMSEVLMNSVLKLPLAGSIDANGVKETGIKGYYWTSTEGNNTAPWRMLLNENTSNSVSAGWAGGVWALSVRCVKE